MPTLVKKVLSKFLLRGRKNKTTEPVKE